jgi:diguanylate cyclase (GGDEF)-like protein/PAS domain S-box-containing protein
VSVAEGERAVERAITPAAPERPRNGFYIVDEAMRIVEANAVARALLGGSRDPRGLRFGDIVPLHWPPGVADEVETLLATCLATGESHHDPEVVERDDVTGEERVFDWRLERFFRTDGSRAALCTFRDITEHVAARTARGEADRRYRSLFASIDQGFCILRVHVDATGAPCDYTFVETNPAFDRQSGLSGVVGRSIRSILGDAESRRWIERYGRVARTGEAERFVDRVPSLARWYDEYAFPVGAPEERLVGVLFSDISARIASDEAQRAAEEALRQSEANYRLLFESIDEGFLVLELLFDDAGRALDARYLQVNPASGLSHDVVGRTVVEVFGKIGQPWLDRLARVARSGEPERFVDYATALGRWYEASAFRVGGPADHTVAMLFSDVSDRLLAERQVRESEERYRLLTESLPDVAWACDGEGAGLVVNRRGAMAFAGVPATLDELIGSVVHPDDRERVRAAWWTAREETVACECECRLQVLERGFRWHLVRGAPVKGPEGEVSQWIGVMTDIDDQKRREQETERHRVELQHRMHHDALTGLPNRVLFEDRLGLAIASAARHDRILAVLFVDLDGFKLVNDRFGHATGDAVLEETARRLRSAIRKGDTLARLHGDEFAVLLPEVQASEDAGRLAQSLLVELGRPIDFDGRSVVVGASVGISLFPQDGSSAVELLRAADVAMYRAKLDGKHEVRYFDPSLEAPTIERATLVERLDGALARGDIGLRFQPQWDSRFGSVTAIEALLSWHDARLGIVQPDRLATVAEERGAFGDIVSWSLDAACSTARALGDHAGLPVRVAFNVTTTRLMRGNFLPMLTDAIERHALEAGQLELELTLEAQRFGDPVLRRQLDRVRERGVRITFDRFGGAPGMLAPLLDFPIDAVKLDPSIVHRAESDLRFRHGLSAVITLLHDLELEVLALGIESEAQRDLMLEFGCARLQGYFLGAPTDAEGIADLLRRQGAPALFGPPLEEERLRRRLAR